MLRAAICDDEVVILSTMKSSIEKTFLQEKFDFRITPAPAFAVYKPFLPAKNY